MAATRPNDYGSQFPSDAADSAPTNPITNRNQIDYTTGPQRATSTTAAVADDGATEVIIPAQQVRVKAEGNDSLTGIAVTIVSEDDNSLTFTEQGSLITIAKPPRLRRNRFDGQEVDGYTITYIDQENRILTDENGGIIYQRINRKYEVDIDFLYVAQADDTGIEGASYIDLNVDGRRFETFGVREFLVKAINDDTLTCVLNDDQDGDEFTIAKPRELQRSHLDGETDLSGYSYAYSSPSARTKTFGGDSEDQIIVEPYVVDESIILAAQVENLSSLTGTLLQDLNVAGRGWGVTADCV